MLGMFLILGLLAGQEAPLGIAGGQSSQPTAKPRPPVVHRADWFFRPSQSDIARVYPYLAARLLIDGSATVECRIRIKGAAENCVVLNEAPIGFGFGVSAMQLARAGRFTPERRDGVAIDGAVARLPMRFTVVEAWPAYPLNYSMALDCVRWHSARLVILPNDPLSMNGLARVEATARRTGEKAGRPTSKVEADIAKVKLTSRADWSKLKGASLDPYICARGF